MPKVPWTLDHTGLPGNIKPEEPLGSFVKLLRKLWEQMARIVNGGLAFGDGINGIQDNIDGMWINVATPGAANTNFTVTHNLGRIPTGYIVMRKDATCDIYDGSVAATVTQLTLKSTATGVNVRLFIV